RSKRVGHVCKPVAKELVLLANPVLDCLYQSCHITRLCLLPCRFVEFQRICACNVYVVSLPLDLVWKHDWLYEQRRIHEPANFVREVIRGKVEKCVHQEHYGIRVAVAVPALGRMPDRRSKTHL